MEGNQRSRGEKETPEDKCRGGKEREEHPNNNHPQHKKRGKTSKEATGERESVKTPNTSPGLTEERPDEGSKAPGPAAKDNPSPNHQEGGGTLGTEEPLFAKIPRRRDNEPRRRPLEPGANKQGEALRTSTPKQDQGSRQRWVP